MYILSDNDHILWDGENILFATDPPDFVLQQSHFFGQSDPDQPRPETVNLSTITRSDFSSSTPSFEVLFDPMPGYLIFAEPLIIPIRTSYFIDEFRQGAIGGLNDLFPNPTIQQFEGRAYRVYISNHATQIEIPIRFIYGT
jgi:hypothetical protein